MLDILDCSQLGPVVLVPMQEPGTHRPMLVLALVWPSQVPSSLQVHDRVQVGPERPWAQLSQWVPLKPPAHVHCPEVWSQLALSLPGLLQSHGVLQFSPKLPLVQDEHVVPLNPIWHTHCPEVWSQLVPSLPGVLQSHDLLQSFPK